MCFATPSKARAALGVGFPIVGLGIAIVALLQKGYSLADYPLLIQQGHLNWFSQGLGWIGLAIWIVQFWPPSFSALRESCLIGEQGEAIRLASGPTLIRKDEIVSIEVKRTFFNKTIKFVTNDEKTIFQSAILIKEDARDVVRTLGARLETSQGEAA